MQQKDKISLDNLPQPIKMHIERLERVRRDFVANVSHELRTPLTVIRGYLESLLAQEIRPTESLRKILLQMYQHSIRMENLIEDLLLLSRLESDEQLPRVEKKVHVADMLKTLCIDAENISGRRHHEIKLIADESLWLEGAEDELKSLFSNIIVNAVKYTPAKGHIDIEWYENAGAAMFKVKDTGIGVARQHIPRLTERFYRVDKARSRESGGTGLGLAIVKHVLIRHGGELKIESKLGKGSTFICLFPKSRSFVIKLS